MVKKIDLTGKRFGRLTVVCDTTRSRSGMSRWQCVCDCGEIITAFGQNLRTGHTSSCGCLRREATSARRRSHGLSSTTEYASWCDMIRRCHDERNSAYSHYGARGVVVCSRWRESFEAFVEDMGQKEGDRTTIDRIDNDGNYSCGKCDECVKSGWAANCRWASRHEQSRNTSRNVVYEIDGVRMCLTDWCAKLGIHICTAKARLRRGLTIFEALEIGDKK